MKKISKLQIFRFIIQVMFLILLPGLFTLTFSQIKEIYTMVLAGNFNFIDALPNLIELLAVIPITILFGRFFCGWMCAFGTVNDMLYLLSNKVFKINFKVSEKLDSVLKYLKYVILLFIVVVIWTMGSEIFTSSSPWGAFAQITDISEAISAYTIGFILLSLIVVGAFFIERFFCRYLCPLGAVLSVTSRVRLFNISKVRDNCGSCRACTNNCSMGIPLYKVDKVRSGECTNCLKCVSICPRKNAQVEVLGQNINPAFGGAVAVAAFVGIYSVNNILGASAEATTASTSNTVITTSTQSGSTATYKDGTYTGTGRGYKPGLQVTVTIKDNKITNIVIGSNNETPSYSKKPFSTVPSEIISAQSTDVDTVSGATRTSEGIIMAVEDALSDALVSTASSSTTTTSETATTNSTATTGSTASSGSTSSKSSTSGTASQSGTSKSSSSSAASSSTSSTATAKTITSTVQYTDGTYTGTGRGYKPGLQVTVTVKSNKITNIVIGSNNETPRYAQRPFSTIPSEIISAQSTNVDTVSGATRTSEGIIMAVENALSQAKK